MNYLDLKWNKVVCKELAEAVVLVRPWTTSVLARDVVFISKID